MLKLKLLLLSTLLTLCACKTLTPIAVATPKWVVPAADPALKAQEQASLQELAITSQAWAKWLSALPEQTPTPPAP